MEIEKNDTNKDSIMQDFASPKKQRIIFLSLALFLLIVVSINCDLFDEFYEEDESSWQDATRTSIKVTQDMLKKTVDAATGTQEYKNKAADMTSYWKANAPVLTGIVSTQTSIAKTQDVKKVYYDKTDTAIVATLDSEQTQTAKEEQTQTAEAKIPKPPVITYIEMPSYVVPKTGEAVWVTIYYEDPDGDVSHYKCEVIDALNWTCSINEIKNWGEGTRFEGTFRYTLTCYGNQNVTLGMRLIDKKGNMSNAYTLSFVCR